MGSELAGKDPPFCGCLETQQAVAVQEPFLRLPELRFQGLQPAGDFLQLRIGQEVTETIEERERVLFDERMGPAFDEGQFTEGILGQKPFVTEADEPVGDLVRLQAQVLGFEPFAPSPVTHLHGEQDAAAIRRHEQNATTAGSPACRIPIVALTASVLQEDRQKALDAGMDDFITKPIIIAEFESAVTKWIASRCMAA